MTTEVIERKFSVSGEAYLKLANIRGSVTVQGGPGDQIEITATKDLSSGDGERTEIEMEQAEDGKVSVKTRFPEGIMGFLNMSSPCKVDYVVVMPRQCEAHISGVSCSVSVQDLEGKIKVKAVSGSVHIASLSGELNASTVSGSITGSDLTGSIKLESVSGSARLTDSNLDTINASTVSGSIKAQSPLGAGPYSFQTVSGSVKLELAEESPFKADLRTVSGSLKVNVPGVKKTKHPGRQEVVYGEGGPEISVGSVSGSLKIYVPNGDFEELEHEAAKLEGEQQEEANENGNLTSEKRREILEKISDGEISVEEGLNTLKN